MYHKILVALEGQKADQAVLDHIQTLAAQIKAGITLLRVIPVTDDGGALGKQFQIEIGSSGWRRKLQATAYLSRLQQKLQVSGLSVETVLVIGTRSVADEIVSYAAAQCFDLIAMTSDSRPWYKRLFRDSQDDDVMRKSTVPTLFVGETTRRAPATTAAPKAHPVMEALGTADL